MSSLKIDSIDPELSSGNSSSSFRVPSSRNSGFTLVEILVVMLMIGIISTVFFTSFNTATTQYLYLQKSGIQFSELSASSHRLANVLRGTTDFIATADNEVTVYAYFAPNNNYVSQIRYYLNSTNTALMADVTPMTANPPIGTPVTSGKVTYTIISNFYKAPGVNLFTYLDSGGNTLALPVSDQHIIKGIKLALAVPGSGSSAANQTMNLNVGLRNRKTNL
jgi:prepilin-type N-terminal cleavage/methylation domain-containing protein